MVDCCARDASPKELDCPRCGTVGRSVPQITVKSLLTPRALERLAPGEYRFCIGTGCDVVYFSRETSFGRADLRVPVFRKEPKGHRMICYCFEIAEGDTDPSVEARIRAHVRAGRCACEVRNPEGTCCLSRLKVLD